MVGRGGAKAGRTIEIESIRRTVVVAVLRISFELIQVGVRIKHPHNLLRRPSARGDSDCDDVIIPYYVPLLRVRRLLVEEEALAFCIRDEDGIHARSTALAEGGLERRDEVVDVLLAIEGSVARRCRYWKDCHVKCERAKARRSRSTSEARE